MKDKRSTKKPEKSTVTFDTVREIAAALPGVQESTSWGSPSFKVNGKLFLCMANHSSSEPNSLIVNRIESEERDAMVSEDPVVFYFTSHYANYPCVLIRLSKVSPSTLRAVIETAYRRSASGRARSR